MHNLRLFAWAMFKKWWTLMSCAVFTFLGLYSLVFQKSNAWVIGVSIVAGVSLFFWASFLVWNDEHEQLERTQQPDIGLLWDWTEDDRAVKRLDKNILIHNRSKDHIYNIQIEPISLSQTMEFDLINELGPNDKHIALARWNDKSSLTTDYAYFFCNQHNAEKALESKWMYDKIHNRGLSPNFYKLPMRVTYDCKGLQWSASFEFIYDPGGDDTQFLRKSGQRH